LPLKLTVSDADALAPNRDDMSADSTLSIAICVSCPGEAFCSCLAVRLEGSRPSLTMAWRPAESELELVDNYTFSLYASVGAGEKMGEIYGWVAWARNRVAQSVG